MPIRWSSAANLLSATRTGKELRSRDAKTHHRPVKETAGPGK
jgi:gas vesicle protein